MGCIQDGVSAFVKGIFAPRRHGVTEKGRSGLQNGMSRIDWKLFLESTKAQHDVSSRKNPPLPFSVTPCLRGEKGIGLKAVSGRLPTRTTRESRIAGAKPFLPPSRRNGVSGTLKTLQRAALVLSLKNGAAAGRYFRGSGVLY
jgi:hypothetical protein